VSIPLATVRPVYRLKSLPLSKLRYSSSFNDWLKFQVVIQLATQLTQTVSLHLVPVYPDCLGKEAVKRDCCQKAAIC